MSEQFDPYYLWLGIPPEESAGGAPNHYRLLGLRLFEPNREVISYAVDQRSAHLRSFQTGKRAAESQKLLNEVAAAGVCLLDGDKKRAYDRQLLTNLKLPSLGSAARTIAEPQPHQAMDGAEPVESSSAPQVVTIDSPEIIDSPQMIEPPPVSEERADDDSTDDAPAPAGPPKLALTVGAAAGALALLSIAAVVVGLVASTTDPEVVEEQAGPRVASSVHNTLTIPRETGAVTTNPPAPKAAATNHGETNPVISFAEPPVMATTSPPQAISTGQPGPSLSRQALPPVGKPTPMRATPALPEEDLIAKTEPAATLPAETLTNSIPDATLPATAPPGTTPVVTPGDKPVAPVVTPAPPAGKRPLPPAAELVAKTEEARKLYDAEIKQAARPEDKKMLAARIQKQGEATTTWTDRYVLLDLARKVYVQAGAVDDALETAAAIESEYDIPLLRGDMILATMEALDDVALAPFERSSLARSASRLADTLVESEEYKQAEKAANIALQSANRQPDTQLKQQVGEQRLQIFRMATKHAAVRLHLQTLATSPFDKAANAAAGRFYCLVLEDWPRGLEHLETSGDAVFAGPARLDLATKAPGATAVDRLKAAESWLQVVTISSAGDREDRRAIQRRAKALLEYALPDLTGLEKIRAEKKLQGLPELGPARRVNFDAAPTATADAASDPRQRQRLIGVLNRNGVGTGVVVRYELGYQMTQNDADRLVQAAGGRGIARNGGISLALEGEFSLAEERELIAGVTGKQASGGSSGVFIDGRSVVSLSDDGANGHSRLIKLAAGKHTIRWAMIGVDLAPGSASLTPAQPAAGAAPPFFVSPDPEREAELAQNAVGRTLTIGRLP